jgi:hypothetical protein
MLAALLITMGATLGDVPFAHAQPTEEDIAVLREEARELYRKGMARFQSGHYAQARASFLAAWSLEPHWSIALALGDCFLKMGRYRDAAEHLDFALRGMPPTHASRPPAEKAMAEVRTHVAALTIDAEREGVAILVDDVRIGISPLAGPVFVEPGRRKVEARSPGHDTVTISVDAVAGSTHPVRFPSETPVSVVPPREEPQPVRQDPPSNAKYVVLGTGLGLSAVAAGFGVAYLKKKSAASDDISSLQGKIDRDLGPDGCLGSSSALCSDLQSRFDDESAARTRATVAWAAFGVLLVATPVTYFAWPEDDHAAREQGKRQGGQWTLAPVLTPDAAMISWQGRLP